MELMDLTKIRQPYALTMSKHKLNVHEMRVMFRVVEQLQGQMASKIQKDLFGNLELHLETKKLLPEGSQNYSAVKSALNSLEAKKMEVIAEDKDGKYQTRVGYIRKPKYYLNNSMVKLEIDSELVDVYLDLANGYTRYALEVAFNSDSSYTMKLYQYISHWKDKSSMTIDYWDLRDYLNLGDKYKLVGDFKKRILNPAVKELKEKGDVWFEYSDIKRGRTITGFIFQIHNKVTSEKQRNQASVMEEQIIGMLRRGFEFGNSEISKLKPLLNKPEYHSQIMDFILDVDAERQKRRGTSTEVKSIRHWAMAAFIKRYSKEMM